MKQSPEDELKNLLESVRHISGSSFFSYTVNPDKTISPLRGLGLFFNRLLAVTEDIFKDIPIRKLRILDLGSYEGVNAIPFAMLGATVVAVEGREVNFVKMKAAKEYLGLKKMEVVQADVRTITKEKYGQFDLVLACGIMYHLDAESVFSVTKNIFEMTKTAAVIDTHIALSRSESRDYEGKTYWGIIHKEFDVDASSYAKKFSLAHALDNNDSFWFTRISWLNLLKVFGWNTVYECFLPFVESDKGSFDRITFVAFKNLRFKSFFNVPVPQESLPEIIGAKVMVSSGKSLSYDDNGNLVR